MFQVWLASRAMLLASDKLTVEADISIPLEPSVSEAAPVMAMSDTTLIISLQKVIISRLLIV